MAGFDAHVRAGLGLPRHADRDPDREAVRQEPADRAKCSQSRAPMPPNRSNARRRTSSASACSANGTTRTRRWTSGNEADEIRALGKIMSTRAIVYRGLKPVNWCFDCGSALAEAEVEYHGQGRPGGRRRASRCATTNAKSSAAAFGLSALPDKPVAAVIWTTTPWTIPANQALNCIRNSATPWSTPSARLLLLATERKEALPRAAGACHGTTIGAGARRGARH